MRFTRNDSYKITFIFLDDLYQKNSKIDLDGVGNLASDMSLLSDGHFVDPAVWHDFNKIIDSENCRELLDSYQVSVVIKKFLEYYKNNFGFDLDNAIQEFHKLSSNKENFKKYIESIINNSENDEKMVLHLFRNE